MTTCTGLCLVACRTAPDRGTEDTHADPGDRPDPPDTAPPVGLAPELLVPPPDYWQAQHFTVPPDRGLVWELDTDFRLENLSVPHVFVRPDGGFGMLVTNMSRPEGRWMLASDDGLGWSLVDGPVAVPGGFPQDCGNRLEDGLVVVRQGGGMHLVLEGSQLDTATDLTASRTWCHGWMTQDQGTIAVAGNPCLPSSEQVAELCTSFPVKQPLP
ncbi:MAG: hypothetical protein QGG40_20990, partial [Myxococcota bacterium]|nr:hypothetical protein [Myxococcota bacterium]